MDNVSQNWLHVLYILFSTVTVRPPRQTKVFKSGSSGFPFDAKDYGNSTTTGPPVAG